MTVESSGASIVIDAGSGLMQFEKELYGRGPDMPEKPKLDVLISHLHFDHIIGFSVLDLFWAKDSDVRVYTCSRDERPLKEQLFGAFRPPYWPSSLADASGAQCIPVESAVPFRIEHFTVTPFAANHPDKTLSFHISDGERSIVHLLDNETANMPEKTYKKLMELCSEADLVVFDSAYSAEDYPKMVGWGHSTVEHGVKLAMECKPKRMMFSHYSQQYSDKEIDSWTRFFKGETEFILGSEGMELSL